MRWGGHGGHRLAKGPKVLSENDQSPQKSEFWYGVRETLPLVVGAMPFGIIFGALGITSGLSPAGTLAMSAFVFAGSAQFIATGLIASDVSIPLIILTTLVVNLRHMLYGASLGPYMRHLDHRWLVPLGFWLTDESFAVTITRYGKPDRSAYKHWYFLGSAVFMYTNWQVCTYIGLRVGQMIPDPAGWGLDFAMVATFLGMLVPLVRGRAMLTSVVVAGVVALLANSLPSRLGLIIAAISGIGAGVIVELRSAERAPDQPASPSVDAEHE